MQLSQGVRPRWPLWLATVLVVVIGATWWWASSDDAVVPAPAPAPIPPVVPAPAPAPIPAAPKPVEPALSASAFKLMGTVMAADSAGSFAMVRRTADSQLLQWRTGDRVEGLVVSVIGPDSVTLTGPSQTIVIEADRTEAAPAAPVRPRPVSPSPPPAPQQQPDFPEGHAPWDLVPPFGH